MVGVGGNPNYPTTEERVFRKWLDFNYPQFYNKIERTKKLGSPMTWFEAAEEVDSSILKNWDAGREKALKKYAKQIYNRQ